MSDELNESLLANPDKLARLFGRIALRAGQAIMKVRDAAASNPHYKSDGSPVTAADLASDEIIRHALAEDLPGVPVITEESCAAALARMPSASSWSIRSMAPGSSSRAATSSPSTSR